MLYFTSCPFLFVINRWTWITPWGASSSQISPSDSLSKSSSLYRMIPRLMFRVLWGVEDIAILWICFSDSRFNDCCFRWHSIIKPPDFSLVTFLTSPAQFLIFFSIAKCDNLVSGIPPSLLFKTIKRDQLLENSISSSYLLSFFLFLGFIWNLLI